MKKLIMTGIFLITAVAVQATIIASDDFSSGTVGTQIDGVAVQSGAGTWTKAILNPLEFGAGGQASTPSGVDNGYALISSDYSSYTEVLKMTTVFSVGASKPNNPGITMGFYESITMGHLQNEAVNDFVAVRFLSSGANEGILSWRIYDEGIPMDTTSEGSIVTFASSDVIRLTLSYDLQTGAANAEAYNITQGSVINTGTATVPGLNGFNYAGMGVLALDSAESDSFYFDSIQVEAIPEPATLGMVVALGGGLLWVRRVLMV